jgi:hypothetical protein
VVGLSWYSETLPVAQGVFPKEQNTMGTAIELFIATAKQSLAGALRAFSKMALVQGQIKFLKVRNLVLGRSVAAKG